MPHPASQDPIACRLYLFDRGAFDRIRLILPPPLDESPQGYAERDQAVIAAIIQLAPANALEAELAAMAVADDQLRMHYMREAQRNEHDRSQHDRLMAQAARLGRHARGCLAALKRAQKLRIKCGSTQAGTARSGIVADNASLPVRTSPSAPPKGVQKLLHAVEPAAAPIGRSSAGPRTRNSRRTRVCGAEL